MEQLIKKYWDNTLTAEEKRKLQTWLAEKDSSFTDKLREEFLIDLKNHEQNTEKMEEKFSLVLDNIKSKVAPVKMRNTKTFKLPSQVWQYAAAVILLISIVFFLKFEATEEPILVSNQIIENPHSDRNISVTLADQSNVVLYPHSQISLTSDYNQKERIIKLQKGKALFKVAKNKEKRFVVNSGDYQTTALGTEFEVDTENGNFHITLNEGKIVVKSSPNAPYTISDYYLNPKEAILINPRKHTLTKENTISTPTKIIAKKDDSNKIYESPIASTETNAKEINFNKDSLDNVFDELSKIHNISIKYNKVEIENKLFTGKIKVTDNLDSVLSIICESNDLQINKNRKEFLISKK